MSRVIVHRSEWCHSSQSEEEMQGDRAECFTFYLAY